MPGTDWLWRYSQKPDQQSLKGIRKSINKKINERKFLTGAMRKIKVKDQDRQE